MNLGNIKQFTGEHIEDRSWSLDFEGKILVLPISTFKEEYQKPEFQLVKATGGFGCDPEKMGTAVFVKFLVDGEECRYRRNDFIGVLKEELVQKLGLGGNDNA